MDRVAEPIALLRHTQVLAEHSRERGVDVDNVVMDRRVGIGEQQKSHAICGRVRSR